MSAGVCALQSRASPRLWPIALESTASERLRRPGYFLSAKSNQKRLGAGRGVLIRVQRIRMPCASRLRRGRLTAHPCADSRRARIVRAPLRAIFAEACDARHRERRRSSSNPSILDYVALYPNETSEANSVACLYDRVVHGTVYPSLHTLRSGPFGICSALNVFLGDFLTPGILPSAASRPAPLFAPLLRRSARAKKSPARRRRVEALPLQVTRAAQPHGSSALVRRSNARSGGSPSALAARHDQQCQ
jgi:hypothetical protein